MDKMLLVLEDKKTGKYHLPQGKRQANESAQCVAHKQTWLNTGFNVQVSTYLGDINPSHSVFYCQTKAGVDQSLMPMQPPAWVNAKVKSIQLVDPFRIQPSQWQQYDELIKVRGMFNRANHG